MSEAQNPWDDLVALQRREFREAEKLDHWQFACQILTLVVAVASLFIPEKRAASTSAVCSILLAGWTFWLIYRERQKRLLAEKARRITVLVGLGLRVSVTELRRLTALSGASQEELVDWKDPGFFKSRERSGVRQAAHMALENAFWSSNLYRASQETLRLWLIVPAFAMVLCLLLTLDLLPGHTYPDQVRVFSTIASSLIFLELLVRTAHYGIAWRETDEVFERLRVIVESGYDRADLILALMNYNAAVETAPMMAPGVYSKNKTRLERIWNERYPKVYTRIWVVPRNDLETETIIQLLENAGESLHVTQQSWGASWERLEPAFQEELRQAPPSAQIFGIELGGSNPYQARNIDHHRYGDDDRWRAESSLEQVAEELGVTLNRWQRLVAANDRGYIPELLRVGAEPLEIREIRTADRRAQGLTEVDERRAEADVSLAESVGGGRLVVSCEKPTAAHLDLLISKGTEVLLQGKEEWLYSGPRHLQLAAMHWEQPTWSGGQPDSGYFGIRNPDTTAQSKIRAWFEHEGGG